MNELNKKMLKFAGLVWIWPHSPDCNCGAIDDDDSARSWYHKQGNDYHLATRFYHEDIDFTDPEFGIAYCFKWLVPKLDNLVLRYRH
ncbi:hypothetical protein LCGC14_3073680, partial [marine sediment metagenome]